MRAIALKDLDTEDWKTALVRPKDFPTIPKGSEVEYLGTMDNWYGTWAKIKGLTGYTYYVRQSDLDLRGDE